MTADIFAVVGVGMVAAVLAVVLRQHRPEFAVMVSLGTGVLILLWAAGTLLPVVEQVNAIMDRVSLPPEYAAVLFKALGVCFLTQVACDTCKDAGESAIAAKIEMAGKATVLALSLPLFNQVLSVVYSLIG